MRVSPLLGQTLNKDIQAKSDILGILRRKDLLHVLKEFDFNWENGGANSTSELGHIFLKHGWLNDQGQITKSGKLIYSRIALHFHELDSPNALVMSYRLKRRVRSGKNSVIFEAEHIGLGNRVVLKFLRPGASDEIETALRKISTIDFGSEVVVPTDIFDVDVRDVTGQKLTVKCLVFPFASGESFAHFLETQGNHLNSHLVISFVKQVGAVLRKLELADAYHGDLHEENILVAKDTTGRVIFRVLDISYGAVGSTSREASRQSDLEYFKQHLLNILVSQKRFISNVSLRKYIGTNYHSKIQRILSDEVKTFVDVERVFEDEETIANYHRKKQAFINEKFKIPASFRLQRYEEFTDPSVAARLFVPFVELQSKINVFGNVYVSGNRGSGKSTYLSALAYFPSIEVPLVDPREVFGIYFPCRQGEFKAFPKAAGSDGKKLLHIVIFKILRRALEAISSSRVETLPIQAKSLDNIQEFLNNFLPAPGIVPIEPEVIPEIDNILGTLRKVELDLQSLTPSRVEPAVRLLSPSDLKVFFDVIRDCFPTLARTKFHILFDDAGTPYVPQRVQASICDLMIASNNLYCIKVSAEKNSFKFLTCDEKILEVGHDYFEQDISYNLVLGASGSGLSTKQLEQYFRRIVEERLKEFKYRSSNVEDYLGDHIGNHQQIMHRVLLRSRKPFYYGWTAVWNIADRTPRNLLELVSEIFAAAKISKDTKPFEVMARDQNRAIVAISEKRLSGLSQFAGSLRLNGEKSSLGRQLHQVTATLGSVFHTYLVDQREAVKGGKQPRQYLAIERNDLANLSPAAEEILKKLVTYGVLDSSRSLMARDDKIKKPLYVLNRIFCPAFRIGYSRDENLKLSAGKFEQLLLSPREFKKSGTGRLRRIADVEAGALDLFSYPLNDPNEL